MRLFHFLSPAALSLGISNRVELDPRPLTFSSSNAVLLGLGTAIVGDMDGALSVLVGLPLGELEWEERQTRCEKPFCMTWVDVSALKPYVFRRRARCNGQSPWPLRAALSNRNPIEQINKRETVERISRSGTPRPVAGHCAE